MRNTPECSKQDKDPISLTRKTDSIDTQELRKKWITELDDLFDMANLIAKGKVDQQQVNGKLQSVTPKERLMWAQVAANVAQVIGNLSKAHDDTQFNDDLARLENLMKEVHRLHDEAEKKLQQSETGLATEAFIKE